MMIKYSIFKFSLSTFFLSSSHLPGLILSNIYLLKQNIWSIVYHLSHSVYLPDFNSVLCILYMHVCVICACVHCAGMFICAGTCGGQRSMLGCLLQPLLHIPWTKRKFLRQIFMIFINLAVFLSMHKALILTPSTTRRNT